jgi:hypothetical protein
MVVGYMMCSLGRSFGMVNIWPLVDEVLPWLLGVDIPYHGPSHVENLLSPMS